MYDGDGEGPYPHGESGDRARMERRRARLAERRRRRRRNVTIAFAVAAALVVAAVVLIILSPFGGGPGKSKESPPKTEAKTAPATTAPNQSSQPAASSAPAGAARVEKKSDTRAPCVAIVVDDVGNTTDKLPLWLTIDAPINFAVMPYPPLSQQLAEQLYQAGYLVMMHVPTDNAPPNSFSGKGQLATGMNRDTVFQTLDADVATVPHAEGINNHQGGRGCDQPDLMTYEVEWAKSKGLFVVDSASSANSKVTPACLALGLGKRLNQVFIDHQNEPDYIRGAMRELAALARENGTAIGICHWHRPNTAAVVGEMVKVLKAEGIHFAFVRDITN